MKNVFYVFIVFVSNVFFSYHIIKNVITNENFSCRCFMDRLSLFLFRVNDHKVNGCNVDWDSDPDPDFNSYLFPISKPLFTFLNKLLKKSFENNSLSVKQELYLDLHFFLGGGYIKNEGKNSVMSIDKYCTHIHYIYRVATRDYGLIFDADL